MAKIATLLTRPEAVAFSELGAKFPQCQLSDILQTEEWEFRNCLGWELYEKMLSALADYSGAKAWASQNYTVGAVVRHGGKYWASNRGGTNTEPLTENEYWSLAPKFDSQAECGCEAGEEKCGAMYNEIWCRYLGRYLSLKLAKLTIPRIAVEATGTGVVRTQIGGAIPADKNEIEFLLRGVEAQTVQVFENMMAWIKAQGREDCFGEFDENCKPVKKECEQECRADGCSAKSPKTVGISVY